MEIEVIVNLVLLGTLFVASLVGFFKGFIHQAVELAGTIATFVLAILMSNAVAEYLAKQFQFPFSVALVIGFVALVLLGLVASRFIATVVSKIVKMTVLRFVDRLAGGILGLIFGMILCSLLITAVLELPFDYDFRHDVARSQVSLFLRPIAGEVFDWILAHAPTDLQYEDIFKHGNSV